MADKDNKPACKYGADCYQRNQPHKDKFSHPPKESNETARRSSSPTEPMPKRQKTVTPPPKSESENDSQSENEHDNRSENEHDDESDPTPGVESNGNEKTDRGNGSSSTAPATDAEKDEKKDSKPSAGSKCSEFIMESFDKGPHAQRVEHKKLLDSPAEFIRANFLAEMPSDFFSFWEFCEAEAANKSTSPENVFAKLGLKLVGPFDVLAKKFHDIGPFEPGEYLRHWRFYYDPPEFQVGHS